MYVYFFLSARLLVVFVFFFSSRRRHTRSKRDWSSDVLLFRSSPNSMSGPGCPFGQYAGRFGLPRISARKIEPALRFGKLRSSRRPVTSKRRPRWSVTRPSMLLRKLYWL